jgi:uncharacterized protein YpbB
MKFRHSTGLGDQMEISYRDAVFLYCLKQIKDERSIYSIFHLFQGKKSSQTIQDAHLYNLTAFFRAFPLLTRTEMETIVKEIQSKGFLDQMSTENYRLTEKGQEVLHEFQKVNTMPPRFLEGWKYHHLTTLFWERLSIFVQVSSNLINKNKGFIPIQNKQETQEWLKNFLKSQNTNRYELGVQLYTELTECLQQEESIEPAVLVLRLTGHNKIGLTTEQAAEKLRMTNTHYQLEFLNILHYMIKTVSLTDSFPLLSSLVQDVQKEVPLTLSTEKTFQLLEKGYLPNEIAAMRNLKMSTIEDHIVEIALHVKEFDLNRYVQPDKQKRIMDAARKNSAKKLKQIRDQVNEANYFEIRLVLARNGGQKWN